ncbi:MAG: ABC transporter permease [Lachnospiraceae bacterium]|jgi:ribose transport system permease protein|nr:ABC transporter permease [Lachnospiraceae bacterium]
MRELTKESSGKTVRIVSKYGLYIVFAVMVVVLCFTNRNFATFSNFMLILQQMAPFGVAAIGMIFVLITAGIDISVGRVMFISGVIVGEIITRMPPGLLESPWVFVISFGAAVLVGALFGAVNGLLITKLNIYPFMATLLMGYIARGLGLTIAGNTKYDVSVLGKLANSRILGIPTAFLIFVALAVLMNFVLRSTAFGKQTMAIGNNKGAAAQIGIHVDRQVIFIYIMSGVFAAAGGLLSAGQISEVFTTFGENNEFQIISAAVIGGASMFGGKGTILPGAIIGVLLIQVVLNGLGMMNASVYIYNVVRGLIIFLAVAIDCMNYEGELR